MKFGLNNEKEASARYAPPSIIINPSPSSLFPFDRGDTLDLPSFFTFFTDQNGSTKISIHKKQRDAQARLQ